MKFFFSVLFYLLFLSFLEGVCQTDLVESVRPRQVDPVETEFEGSKKRMLVVKVGIGGGEYLIDSNADTVNGAKPAILGVPIGVEFYPIRWVGLGLKYEYGGLWSRDSTYSFKGGGQYLAPYLSLRLNPKNELDRVWVLIKMGIGYTWQGFDGTQEEDLDLRVKGKGVWGFLSAEAQLNITQSFAVFIEVGLRYINLKDFKEKDSGNAVFTNDPVPEAVTMGLLGWNLSGGVAFLLK